MTIHLPPHIESSIEAAVYNGRFKSVDDAMTRAATLLLQELDQEQATPAAASDADTAQPRKPIRRFRPACPMKCGTLCQPTSPSSTIIISTARRSGCPHEACLCRFALLDRPLPPQGPAPRRRPETEPHPPAGRDRDHG